MRAPSWRHFLRHGTEMAVSMVVGMMLLDPVWDAVLGRADLSAAAHPDLGALITAADMTVAMTIWMLYRGHGRSSVAKMAAATAIPYLLLTVPFRLGFLSGEQLMMGGHVLMLSAMVAVMLAHRTEYSHPVGGAHTAHPLIGVLGRRWPSWIALALVADNWQHPSVTSAWALLILPAGYLLLGGIRGRLRDRRMLVLQLGGLALYVALILLALNAGPALAAWLVVGGWGIHALWDAAHHRANAVVPRAYAEWCCVLDSVIALTGVLFLVTTQ